MLLIEAVPGACRNIDRVFEGTNFSLVRTSSLEHARDRSDQEQIELILLDFTWSDQRNIDLFEHVQSFFPDLAVVILNDEANDDFAAQVLQLGAQDVVNNHKLNPSVILHVMRSAILRNRNKLDLQFDKQFLMMSQGQDELEVYLEKSMEVLRNYYRLQWVNCWIRQTCNGSD